MVNWRQALKSGRDRLKENNIDDADFDAFQLLLTFFDGSSSEYMLRSGDLVTDVQLEKYAELISRRIKGEPLQYIIGKWDFYSSSFFVGDGVLIPRPETEELVEKCIEIIKRNDIDVVYDLCSGSGCIGLSIAKECPGVSCYLFELYDKAYGYAARNLEAMKLQNVHLIKHDVLNRYNGEIPFAGLIISNPPYIESDEIAELQQEVLYEPHTALDGGEDGLLFYRAIYDKWEDMLLCGGYFAFECGEKQTDAIIELAGGKYDSCAYIDMYGNNRIVISKKL